MHSHAYTYFIYILFIWIISKQSFYTGRDKMLTATKSADSTYLIYVPYSCRPTYNFVVHPPGPCQILKRSLTRTSIGYDEFGDAPLVWSGLTIPLRGGLGDSFLLATRYIAEFESTRFVDKREHWRYKTQVYVSLLRIVKAYSSLIRRLHELYFELDMKCERSYIFRNVMKNIIETL